jgi:hypothetical protein
MTDPVGPEETRAQLRAVVRRLRAALESAPPRHVIQHHGYDEWYRTVRTPALEEAPHAG